MNNKTKLIFFFSTLLSLSSLVQADTDLWQEIHAKARSNNLSVPFSNSRVFTLNEDKMQQLLQRSLQTTSQQGKTVHKGINPDVISLPLPNGKTVFVTPIASEVLPPLLAAKYPQIKTYTLIDNGNEIINGRLDFTPSGFHAMLQTKSGDIIYIDPVSIGSTSQTPSRYYYSYQQKDQHSVTQQQCDLNEEAQQSLLNIEPSTYQYRNKSSRTKNVHNYRIAIAATGEYTQLQGGSVASTLGAIATTINRVNQIYERDLGVHLTLVTHNDRIIYRNADSDPYSNGKSHALILENQETLDTIIGTSNYDIGHVFGTSSGGLAIIDSLCSSSSKAKGTSGISNPNSDNFYIDFVAHEIGHQLGATHTFNGHSGLCSGNTRTARTAFEPGSGSTIMAYTGICGSDNLQSQADAMFHIGSIEQVKKNLASSCGTHSINLNQAPIVNAGRDYTIPAGTPFILQGAASDPENDTLSYSWQQIDTGNRSSVNHDLGNNALFRAYLPNSSTSRTFPLLTDIINHQKTKGETLPNTQRKLSFKLTAQDANKNTSSDQVTLQVKHTGSRFALDLPYSHYTIGESTDITWNVAKTNQAPIACTDIDIYLSTNSGKTFNTLLATNIINNGKASVYIPNHSSPSTNGRFKIACSNNIFFAISYHDFTIGYGASNHQSPPSSEPNLIINANIQTEEENASNQTNYQKKEAGTFNLFILLLMLFILRKNKKVKNRMTITILNKGL